MQLPPEDITSDSGLLKLFANQFAVRMNNRKRYGTKEIATALKELE